MITLFSQIEYESGYGPWPGNVGEKIRLTPSLECIEPFQLGTIP